MAMELSQHKDLQVIVMGGMLRPNWFSLVGPLTEAAMLQILSWRQRYSLKASRAFTREKG